MRTAITVTIYALLFTVAHTAHARPRTPQQVANCIEAGRANGDSDSDIAGRCLPDPALDTLYDYE